MHPKCKKQYLYNFEPVTLPTESGFSFSEVANPDMFDGPRIEYVPPFNIDPSNYDLWASTTTTANTVLTVDTIRSAMDRAISDSFIYGTGMIRMSNENE